MTSLYDTYKQVRKTNPGIPALQARRMARAHIVDAVTKDMRGEDHPLNMPLPAVDEMQVFFVDGFRCCVTLEYDDMWYGDEDLDGFKLEHNCREFYESGWGHQGMDEGEYIADRNTIVVFNETRKDVIRCAPSHMSKQQKYEWATDFMRRKLERFQGFQNDDIYTVIMRVECSDIEYNESIGGIEVTLGGEVYLQEVFEDLYMQLVHELAHYKDVV